MKPIYECSPNDPEYGDYIDEYRAWMYTPANTLKCVECPERKENWRGHEYPCCQQNCWVEVTCHHERFKW